MSGIIIPEMIVYKALESIILYIRNDLKLNTGDKEKNNILYKLLGEDEEGNKLVMNRYNYYVQAKKIFLDPHNLTVSFGYNFDVAKIVALHIVLPAEQPAGSAIGQDEGFDTGDIFTQNLQSHYQIMITSNNGSEGMVVYHVIKSMLLAIIPHLELSGLRLNKISGNDIMFRDELMPNGLFHKVINLEFNYELKVPQLLSHEIIRGIVIEGHLLEDITDICERCQES